MENNELKVGDVVELKSGSDVMTVKSINGDDVVCVWYDYDNSKTVTDTFKKVMLKKQSVDDGPIITAI